MEKKEWTLTEFARSGGIASAKKRLEGMTKEEISERMREVRAGRKKSMIPKGTVTDVENFQPE